MSARKRAREAEAAASRRRPKLADFGELDFRAIREQNRLLEEQEHAQQQQPQQPAAAISALLAYSDDEDDDALERDASNAATPMPHDPELRAFYAHVGLSDEPPPPPPPAAAHPPPPPPPTTATDAAAHTSASTNSPDAWSKVLDPTSNEYYYYHTKTLQVSWERPAEYREPGDDPSPPQPQQQQLLASLQARFEQLHANASASLQSARQWERELQELLSYHVTPSTSVSLKCALATLPVDLKRYRESVVTLEQLAKAIDQSRIELAVRSEDWANGALLASYFTTKLQHATENASYFECTYARLQRSRSCSDFSRITNVGATLIVEYEKSTIDVEVIREKRAELALLQGAPSASPATDVTGSVSTSATTSAASTTSSSSKSSSSSSDTTPAGITTSSGPPSKAVANPSSSKRELPPGWIQVLDQASQRHYYANPSTVHGSIG